MRHRRFRLELISCAYFFICPGLTYGIFTSRLPALKAQTSANDAQIGLIFLCFGLCGLVGLISSSRVISYVGSKVSLCLGSVFVIIGITLCGLMTSPALLALTAAFAGLGMGLADVSMNTQGIVLEQRFRISCMAALHASYSLGGMAGALSGALFAGFNFSVFTNAIAVLGLYACILPIAYERLHAGIGSDSLPNTARKFKLPPFFVLICGAIALLAYSAEGSVAEWGSLFLVDAKGASQVVAALVFAVFSASTVVCRLVADSLRRHFGDFIISFCGGILSVLGMVVAIFAQNPALCLCGYGLMGIGLAPIVPILFSRAGNYSGVNPAHASAVISLFAYSGLLFFPPMLGFSAHAWGLKNALFIIVCICIIITLGTILLKNRGSMKKKTAKQ